MSNGAQEFVVIRFDNEGDHSEELRNLREFLETEKPGGKDAELCEAPEGTAKAGEFVEIVYALLGGAAGGVAEELTKPLVEAVKVWWRNRRETGREPAGGIVVEQRRVLTRVPDAESAENEAAGEA